MKKVLLIVAVIFVSVSLTSCKKTTNIMDSDIDAIRDQTEVLKQHNEFVKEQNAILSRIEQKLK